MYPPCSHAKLPLLEAAVDDYNSLEKEENLRFDIPSFEGIQISILHESKEDLRRCHLIVIWAKKHDWQVDPSEIAKHQLALVVCSVVKHDDYLASPVLVFALQMIH